MQKQYVDVQAYDLGYHMSYSLTAFYIAITFSVMVPYVPLIATVFFLFKYYVDKYNLSFVYNCEFRGTGSIKNRVVMFTLFIAFSA